MLRHACGFKLANDGHDTRFLTSLPRPQEHPAYGALHRTGADEVQGFLAALTLRLWNRVAIGKAHKHFLVTYLVAQRDIEIWQAQVS